MKPYAGPLHMEGLSKDPVARRGMTAINHQRARCENPEHPYYKYYGAKGIRVEYGTREFIGWYIENFKNFKGENPTVGRKDHSKNYRFDNIRFESREENSAESCRRNGHWGGKSKAIKVFENGMRIATAESIIDAAVMTGMSVSTISRHINGAAKRPWSRFRFEAA